MGFNSITKWQSPALKAILFLTSGVELQTEEMGGEKKIKIMLELQVDMRN